MSLVSLCHLCHFHRVRYYLSWNEVLFEVSIDIFNIIIYLGIQLSLHLIVHKKLNTLDKKGRRPMMDFLNKIRRYK